MSVRRRTLFRSDDEQFFLINFDALGERTEVIAAVASAIGPNALAGYGYRRHRGCVDGDLTAIGCELPLPSGATRKIKRIVSGLDRIYLKCLFCSVSALLGCFHDPIADWRKCFIPEVLTSVLLYGPQDTLGILLGPTGLRGTR